LVTPSLANTYPLETIRSTLFSTNAAKFDKFSGLIELDGYRNAQITIKVNVIFSYNIDHDRDTAAETMLENNVKTVAIAAGDNQLFQLHNDGWIWRYTGTPCSGDSCPGWQRLDNNSKARRIAVGGFN
jgi:hypothetical protein